MGLEGIAGESCNLGLDAIPWQIVLNFKIKTNHGKLKFHHKVFVSGRSSVRSRFSADFEVRLKSYKCFNQLMRSKFFYPIFKISLGFIILFFFLEFLARMFFSPTYHPFDFPLSNANFSQNRMDELIRLVSAEKPKDEIRVVLTGGSAAYGIGASSPEFDLAHQLELLLNKGPQTHKVRVLNAGVGSLQSTQELLLYLRFLRYLKPDYVLMFSGYNDLRESIVSTLRTDRFGEIRNLDKIKMVREKETGPLLIATLRSMALNVHQGSLKISRIYQICSNFLSNMDFIVDRNSSSWDESQARDNIDVFINVVQSFQSISRLDGFTYIGTLQPMANCGLEKFTRPTGWLDNKVGKLYKSHLRERLKFQCLKEKIHFIDLNGKTVDDLNKQNSFLDLCHLNDQGYALVSQRLAENIRSMNLWPLRPYSKNKDL
ncbi:MAG: hypothetical protein KCHDKBKB_00116 [Elusimicrobia bacterium]|nr:hypothetical protein [Elusimicrobiota bacterium]